MITIVIVILDSSIVVVAITVVSTSLVAKSGALPMIINTTLSTTL